MILYYLFQVSQNKPKYFIHLAALIGLSFNLHFTAVFYPIILLFALPVIPFHKTTWKYIAAAVGIGILFFVPQIIYYIQKTNGLHAYSSYFQSYYHGFHARRMLQLEHDAFIKFQSILEVSYPFIKDFVIVLVPIFIFIHYRSKQYVYAKQLSYFIALWFFIPWIVFTTYSGELTDYYFSTTLYIAIVILAYLSVWTWDRKNLLFRIAVSAIWVYYGFANIRAFANTNPGNLASDRIIAQNAVEKGKYIGFTDGDPQSYLYFYYIYIRTKQQPYKL